MLELTGEIAMASDDVGAIEAWIQQAQAAALPHENIQPKKDRLCDLKWRRADEQTRKVEVEKLEDAMKGQSRDAIRKAMGSAGRAGAHPRRLQAADRKIEALKVTAATKATERDRELVPMRAERDRALAADAVEKLQRRRLLASPDLDLREDENAALERLYYGALPPAEQPPEGPEPEPPLELTLELPSGASHAVSIGADELGAALLVKLVPLRRQHALQGELQLLLPSGSALDLHTTLREQGVSTGCVACVCMAATAPVLAQCRER
eukprot:NODE_2366_length_949_cov_197.751678.p1 GENE.NODE_2366_length_949_cov_197.751678~~NODE_2366_length_949_cov_197.751678.p1  ORF type:complete len:299 (-),score=87.38 NODE_2366_length_949_cov_197.751678:34-834(-)